MWTAFALATLILPIIVQSKIEKLKFEQPLDHFDHDGSMGNFNQTYFVWDDNWKAPNGPLFIFMGYAGQLLREHFINSGLTVFCAILALQLSESLPFNYNITNSLHI